MAQASLRIAVVLIAGLLAVPAAAADELIRLDDTSLDFSSALNRQVDALFDSSFAASHLKGELFPGLTITALTETSACFYPPGRAFGDDNPGMRQFYRPDENDWCVLRDTLAFRYEPGAGDIPAPKPYGATDTVRCRWQWKTGGGFGLWTEACSFDTGTWAVDYGGDAQGFVLTVNGESPYTVMRAFALPPGAAINSLLPVFARDGTIPADGECVFAPVEAMPARGGRSFFEIVPVGNRKKAYDAQPTDEVPEPACGDYGMSADGISFFAVDTTIPGFAFYINLGQDGTMIDETSIRKL